MSTNLIRRSLVVAGLAALVLAVAADVAVEAAQSAGGHPRRAPFLDVHRVFTERWSMRGAGSIQMLVQVVPGRPQRDVKRTFRQQAIIDKLVRVLNPAAGLDWRAQSGGAGRQWQDREDRR